MEVPSIYIKFSRLLASINLIPSPFAYKVIILLQYWKHLIKEGVTYRIKVFLKSNNQNIYWYNTLSIKVLNKIKQLFYLLNFSTKLGNYFIKKRAKIIVLINPQDFESFQQFEGKESLVIQNHFFIYLMLFS